MAARIVVNNSVTIKTRYVCLSISAGGQGKRKRDRWAMLVARRDSGLRRQERKIMQVQGKRLGLSGSDSRNQNH